MVRRTMSWALVAVCIATSASGEERPKVAVERLSAEPAIEGAQFVSADGDGEVYLLAGATLEVYPVSRHGELGDPERLRPLAGTEEAVHVMSAAVSRSGDEWLVQSSRGVPVRLFRSGKEVRVPSSTWNVTGVAWAGNEPLVSVGSRRPGGGSVGGDEEKPAAVLVLEEREWEPLLAEEPEELGQDLDPMRLRRAQQEVHLAPAGDRSLWWAARNRYWIRQVSPAGKVTMEIAVGDRQVEFRDRNEDELEQLDEVRREAESRGYRIPASHGSTPVAQKVIDGIAEGRDGRLYVLLPPAKGKGSGSRLDRYDPVRGVLERVELDLPGYTSNGRRSFAAGVDGLYVANFKATTGRWRIPWEALEEAPWEPVENSRIE